MFELLQSPLSGLLLTLLFYQAAQLVYYKAKQHPLLHPVLWAALAIAAFLHLTGVPYSDYWKGGQFIHFLLGPATVALAIPLYQQWPLVVKAWKAILGSVLLGSVVGFSSALGIARLLGIPASYWPSLAPKSVTTPIAMEVAQKTGGDPGLAALFVVLTGVLGAMLGGGWFRILRIRDPKAMGLALGVSAHGIGTARAVQYGETSAAFASLGMGLCGLFTAILLPLVG